MNASIPELQTPKRLKGERGGECSPARYARLLLESKLPVSIAGIRLCNVIAASWRSLTTAPTDDSNNDPFKSYKGTGTRNLGSLEPNLMAAG
jgi:hypothetical protein